MNVVFVLIDRKNNHKVDLTTIYKYIINLFIRKNVFKNGQIFVKKRNKSRNPILVNI